MLIDRNGLPVADVWTYLGADVPEAPAQQSNKGVLPLDAWLAADERGVAPAGIHVQGHDEPARIAPLLPRLELIVIEFPKTRDGRGFTLAKILRETWHFEGAIRASGPL